MANLLPKKERRIFESEYIFRLLIVVLLFLIATFLLGVALLLPSYFISNSKEESIKRQSELLQKTIAQREGDATVSSLLSTKQKIDALIETQNKIPKTEVIQSIIQNINENITVDAFYYTKKGESLGEIRITGRAISRAELLSFSDRLKKENLFKAVDLPVSSLAQEANIVFSIIISGDF